MRIVASLSVLALAGCSPGGGGNATAPGGGGPSGGGATASASGLNVVDACTALPRDVVQQAVGLPLKSAELKDITTDSGNGMAGSGCVYDFGEARLVQLQLQQLPTGVDAAGSQAGLRSMVSEGGQPVEDVPGVGRGAFYYAKGANAQLSVVIDGSRTALFSLYRLANVPDPKGKLIAFARRVVG